LLRRTQTAFRKPSEFDIRARQDSVAVSEAMRASPSGALSIFLRKFSNELKFLESQSDVKYEITLIGHSMGAILLNDMIRMFNDLPYKNIVYMGAACSIRDLETSVIPYLQKDSTAQFYNLSLHPLAEKREINYGDIPSRGSLLAWIDNFYASPQTHLDRTLGQWQNIIQATHIFPESVKGQVTLKAFGLRAFGLGKNPQRRQVLKDATNQTGPNAHAEFNDYEFWKPKFREPDTTMVIPPKNVYGGFVEIVAKQTRVRGNWAQMGGIRGGFIFNHTFSIGLSYYKLVSNNVTVDINGIQSYLDMEYTGIDLDFLGESINTQTFFGLGNVTPKKSAVGVSYDSDIFFTFEPSLNMVFGLTDWLQLNIGGSYRFALGVESNTLSNNDLWGASGFLSLKFGRF